MCLETRKWTEGIFCANFGYSVKGYKLCQRMWCGKCDSSKNELEFFIDDEMQLITAADGDDDRLASGWIARKDNKEQ